MFRFNLPGFDELSEFYSSLLCVMCILHSYTLIIVSRFQPVMNVHSLAGMPETSVVPSTTTPAPQYAQLEVTS